MNVQINRHHGLKSPDLKFSGKGLDNNPHDADTHPMKFQVYYI